MGADSRCDAGGDTENEEEGSSIIVEMSSDRSFLGNGSGTLVSGALCRNSYSLSVGGGNLISSKKSASSGLAPRDAKAPEVKPSSTSVLEEEEKRSSTSVLEEEENCSSTCPPLSSVHWMGMENCCSAATHKIHKQLMYTTLV